MAIPNCASPWLLKMGTSAFPVHLLANIPALGSQACSQSVHVLSMWLSAYVCTSFFRKLSFTLHQLDE